jgi:hypothetical protein
MALVPPLSGGMTIQNFARNPVLVNNRLSAACYRTQTLASNLAKSRHIQQQGPRVEHQTEREARQGTLAVYDRRRTRETEKALSDSFNVTKH